MTRTKKPGLITTAPLMSLCKLDYQKVIDSDSRYTGLIPKDSEKSWHDVRREIKPYVFTMSSGEKITVMDSTKTNAIEKLIKILDKQDNRNPRITKVEVEYETWTGELVVPKIKLRFD
jgi:acylphosphatase